MKKLLSSLIAIAFFIAGPAWSAILAPMQWDYRTTATAGNVNSGGFDPTSGTPGTDWSIYNTCKVSWKDNYAIRGTQYRILRTTYFVPVRRP